MFGDLSWRLHGYVVYEREHMLRLLEIKIMSMLQQQSRESFVRDAIHKGTV